MSIQPTRSLSVGSAVLLAGVALVRILVPAEQLPNELDLYHASLDLLCSLLVLSTTLFPTQLERATRWAAVISWRGTRVRGLAPPPRARTRVPLAALAVGFLAFFYGAFIVFSVLALSPMVWLAGVSSLLLVPLLLLRIVVLRELVSVYSSANAPERAV